MGHWERIVLIFAELVAIVLVILFSRRFLIQTEKRSGLFKTALSFFLLFYGTSSLDCTSHGEQGVGATNQARAFQGDSSPSTSPQTMPNKTANVSIPDSLAIGDRWPKFKVFWQKLDRVEPRQRDKNDNNLIRFANDPYAYALTPEDQLRYRAELAAILGLNVNDLARFDWGPSEYAAVSEGALDPLTTVLARLSLRRLQNMGMPMELTTRMIPSRSVRQSGRVIDMMESRIDSLQNLSKQGAVEPDVVSAALEKIQNDVYLLAVLHLVKSYRVEFAGPAPVPLSSKGQAKAGSDSTLSAEFGPHWSEPGAWVRGLDQAYERNIKNAKSAKNSKNAGGLGEEEISKVYRAIREQLDELKRLKPQLDALMSELER